jgi:hypothetical protein
MNEQYAITCKGAMYTLHLPAEFNAAHPQQLAGHPCTAVTNISSQQEYRMTQVKHRQLLPQNISFGFSRYE